MQLDNGFIDVTLNRLKPYDDEYDETLVYLFKNESINGIIYKIIKLPNKFYQLTVNILRFYNDSVSQTLSP